MSSPGISRKRFSRTTTPCSEQGVEFYFPVDTGGCMNMDILVTGATGFLGTALSRHLESLGHQVVELGSRNCDLTKAGFARVIRRSPL